MLTSYTLDRVSHQAGSLKKFIETEIDARLDKRAAAEATVAAARAASAERAAAATAVLGQAACGYSQLRSQLEGG